MAVRIMNYDGASYSYENSTYIDKFVLFCYSVHRYRWRSSWMIKHQKDPDGYGPDDIIARLKRYIDSGRNGVDYTFLYRDKNEEFFSKYIITEDDRIKILGKLTADDYDGWEPSDNPDFPKDIVHIFHYIDFFIPRGIEDAVSERVRLYIKFTWSKYQNSVLLIISFHD